jgi:hypothetical protein
MAIDEHTPADKTLADLEDLLTTARPRAKRECPAIADALRDAIEICRSRHGPLAETHLQLKDALASIRAGQPEDAVASIEGAIGTLSRWSGDVTQ